MLIKNFKNSTDTALQLIIDKKINTSILNSNAKIEMNTFHINNNEYPIDQYYTLLIKINILKINKSYV